MNSEESGDHSALSAENLSLGYGKAPIITELSLDIPQGSFTVILGPNGCGKSTLLRAFAKVLRPLNGRVLIRGADLASWSPKKIARSIAFLPQGPSAPDGLRVADVVARGRFPHRGLVRRWSVEDENAVYGAMESTGIIELSARSLSELSGGQRQRVWIAMTLAQETPILLLDEPTTFLDLAHQVEVLELCAELNSQGKTIVAVLHDLSQAARYASHLIVMNRGQRIAEGPPAEVVTSQLIREVFDVSSLIAPDPVTGTPSVFPIRPELNSELSDRS